MSAGLTSGDFFAMFEGAIRKIIREEMQAVLHPSTEWRDQRQDTVLTPRMHCAAARRRIEQNLPGAKKVGDRYMLTTDAIAEELDRLGRRHSTVHKAAATTRDLTPEDEALALLSRRLQRGI